MQTKEDNDKWSFVSHLQGIAKKHERFCDFVDEIAKISYSFYKTARPLLVRAWQEEKKVTLDKREVETLYDTIAVRQFCHNELKEKKQRNKIFKIISCAVTIFILCCLIVIFISSKGYRYQLMNNVFVLDKQKGILYYLDGNYIKEVNYPEHKINTYNISADSNKKTSKKKSYAGYEIEEDERTFNAKSFNFDDFDIDAYNSKIGK